MSTRQLKETIFLSVLTAIFLAGPGLAGTRMSPFWIVSILDFTGAKDDGSGGDNWTYKMCRTPQSKCHHQQTNTQFFLHARNYQWQVLADKLAINASLWADYLGMEEL